MMLMNKPMLATALQLEHAYYHAFKPRMATDKLGGAAIIPVEGLLMHRSSGFGSSYEEIRQQIQSALDDTSVNHIVLDIDSGGGEVNGLFDLVDFIVTAKAKKQITALVNESAYSAAYLIASCAHQIISPRTGGIGSIGVIVGHLDQSEAEKNMGLRFTEFFAGKHKSDYSPHHPLTEQARLTIQSQVNDTYELLLDALARNRNTSASVFRDTEAKTYLAIHGIALNLVDKIQSPYHFFEELMMTHENAINSPESSGIEQALQNERARAKTILQMCKLAKLTDYCEQLIEMGCSVEEAKHYLFDRIVAHASAPILNTLPAIEQEGEQLIQSMVHGLGGKTHASV